MPRIIFGRYAINPCKFYNLFKRITFSKEAKQALKKKRIISETRLCGRLANMILCYPDLAELARGSTHIRVAEIDFDSKLPTAKLEFINISRAKELGDSYKPKTESVIVA